MGDFIFLSSFPWENTPTKWHKAILIPSVQTAIVKTKTTNSGQSSCNFFEPRSVG